MSASQETSPATFPEGDIGHADLAATDTASIPERGGDDDHGVASAPLTTDDGEARSESDGPLHWLDEVDDKISAVRSSVYYRIPFVHGALPIEPDIEIKLFYGKPGDAHCMDLARPTKEQLRDLEQACAPATFGRNQEDVLDETYRKAGKMDNTDFCVTYTPPEDILGLVRDELYEESECQLRYELYKLNVYGKDSFFKPHKDTPRESNFTATLVMVFPALHEGGQLVFSSGKNEWTVDAASEIYQGDTPHIVYVAFYGDVTHEVRRVTSGHRVTLTWNIFVVNPPKSSSIPQEILDYDTVLKNALADLLADERLLPNGGYLAFGLRYQYPDRKLEILNANSLKGGDAMIKRACDALGVEPKLRLLYGSDSHSELRYAFGYRDDAFFLARNSVGSNYRGRVDSLLDRFRGCDVIRDAGTKPLEYYRHDGRETVWVTFLDEYINQLKDKYVAYGNEACLDTAYASYALLIEVKRKPQGAS